MTRVVLLEQMRTFTEETVKDLLLPVPPPHVITVEEEDTEDFLEEDGIPENAGAECEGPPPPPPPLPPRPVSIFLTALPEEKDAIERAPYILHQVVKSRDFQPPGEMPRSEIVLRTVFCVYYPNGEEGGLALLNLMERLRIAILRQRVIGKQFVIDLAAGVETLVYTNTEPPPYGTAPFYLGEMITTWKIPIVKGEIHCGKEGDSNIKRPGPGAGCGRTAGVCRDGCAPGGQ